MAVKEPLRVSFEDLLAAESRGRWWLVGASWAPNPDTVVDTPVITAPVDDVNSSSSRRYAVSSGSAEHKSLLAMAARQGMNTDVRRTVFVVLMGASSCNDAFERLVRLDLSAVQQREIIRVIVHCCGEGRTYNPFFAHLAVKLW